MHNTTKGMTVLIMLKRFISIVSAAAVALASLTANASVLGSEVIYSATTKFAEGTYFTKNIFYSDQSGVGKQTEYYFEYTPNDIVKPEIINGESLYGKRTINQMAELMENDGRYPIMLLNADYFSFETGVPMSDCVSYGEIITKGGVGTDAIGINEDGSAFMAWLHLYTTINVEGTTINADLINKYRQPYSLYMLTDRFGDETYAKGAGTNVIIGQLSDRVKTNNTVTGVVEQVIHTDGSIEIPEGKIVLTLDDRAAQERQDEIALFKEGQTVTINSSAQGDSRWNDAKFIMGATGGRIITNGTITDTDQAAAPRSAVGITESGKLIFYAIDGRQSGHSYGVRLQTLANRLKELGCVDAINLDGGGSTSITGIFPGHTESTLINTPSDGSLRAVSNFLSLVNTKEATGNLSSLAMYPFTGYYLKGASQEISVLGMDENSHAAPITGEVTLSGENTQINGNTVTFTHPGDITVTAQSGGISSNTVYHVYDNPTSVEVFDKYNNNQVKSLSLNTEGSISLGANSYYGHITLTSSDSCYTWSCDEKIGTITKDGVFTAAKTAGSGNIYVTAGQKTVTLPVTIKESSDMYDTAKHTSAYLSYDNGIFSALITNNDTAKVTQDGIVVRIDGKQTDSFEYRDSVISLQIDNQTQHKITLEITNVYDRTNIFSYTTDGETAENKFNDIEGHWAKDYITYMSSQGVVNGVETGSGLSFLPSQNITRGEFAVMTANYLGINPDEYASVNLPYSDIDSIPDWAINQIKAMYSLGIITGKSYSDGSIRYDTTLPITRCEAAVIISRLLPATTVLKSTGASDSADIPNWAKEGMDKACGAGIIGGYEDGTIKPLSNVTRAEAVKMFYTIF